MAVVTNTSQKSGSSKGRPFKGLFPGPKGETGLDKNGLALALSLPCYRRLKWTVEQVLNGKQTVT